MGCAPLSSAGKQIAMDCTLIKMCINASAFFMCQKSIYASLCIIVPTKNLRSLGLIDSLR